MNEELYKIDQNCKLKPIGLTPKCTHVGNVIKLRRVGGKSFTVRYFPFNYGFPTETFVTTSGAFTFFTIKNLSNLAPPHTWNYRVHAYCLGDFVWQQDIVDCGCPMEATRSSIAMNLTPDKFDIPGEVRVYDVWGNDEDGWQVNDISYTENFPFRYPDCWTMVLDDLRDQGFFLHLKDKDIEMDSSSDEEHIYITIDGRPCLEVNLDYDK